MRKTKPRFYRNRFFVSAAVLAGLIVIVAILELTGTTHVFHKAKIPAVIPSRTSSASGANKNSAGASTPTTPDSGSPAVTQSEGDVAAHDLITPTGNFVSNHFPGQDGSPTTESSTCNTTTGATCYIKFTNVNTGEITQLTTQTTDARGSTSWYWDVNKDAHLTSGQWKVSAIASLGSQTKTADDSLKLTIQ